MKMLLLVAVILVAGIACAAERAFDVRDFGAKPDGKTPATASIQKAIDACTANGGGTVYLPPGVFYSGTIFLKNNVTLWLESGCTLLGSGDLADYPENRTAVRSYTDNYVSKSLIAGENLENVAIRGRGTIDGNGGKYRWSKYLTRPYVIRLVKCRNVLVEGVLLQNSPMWMQHYLACDRVTLRGLTVIDVGGANNDGVDIDACHDVIISDCNFDSDDDAITLKSTLNRACENVAITNCIAASRCNPIKMGTESNGGFKNITIANCTVARPHHTLDPDSKLRGLAGIALEIVDGGTLDRVTINNVAMTGVNVPIFLRLGNRARPFEKDGPKPGMGSFRNVIISNVIATGASKIGCSITGLPGFPIENVTLSNVNLAFDGDGGKESASRKIPELPEQYPESGMFGTLPAYGFYCRHVKGLKFDNLQLRTDKPDQRPALVCDDVESLSINGLDAETSSEAASLLRLTQVRGALIRGCRAPVGTGVFLKMEGESSERIVLAGNDLGQARQRVEQAPDVAQGAVQSGP